MAKIGLQTQQILCQPRCRGSYQLRRNIAVFLIYQYSRNLFFISDFVQFEDLSFFRLVVETRKKNFTSYSESTFFQKKNKSFNCFFTKIEILNVSFHFFLLQTLVFNFVSNQHKEPSSMHFFCCEMKKNYLLLRKHAFFQQHFAIFQPKSRFQTVVFFRNTETCFSILTSASFWQNPKKKNFISDTASTYFLRIFFMKNEISNVSFFSYFRNLFFPFFF